MVSKSQPPAPRREKLIAYALLGFGIPTAHLSFFVFMLFMPGKGGRPLFEFSVRHPMFIVGAVSWIFAILFFSSALCLLREARLKERRAAMSADAGSKASQ